VRVLWFRLDRGDRDWVGFLAYLVAAVRIHVPDFGPSTSALLRETATAAPPLDAVLDTFLRELGGLPNDALALVFDDFHLVDDAPDVRHIVRELLARGPERMSFVFASRHEPPIRLARLRALGEVAELGTDDLRFDPSETERLFRETYEMRLEPALLAELSRRTEGWAASLQLVRAALHERNPAQVRAFISSLSGAEGHLYEYLAEEVVGDLPAELQQFLMRTSLLETVDLALGPVAAAATEAETRAFIEDGERHGLFGKGGPNTRHIVRAHPLVRDFLQARLVRSIGVDGVREIHLRVAQAAEPLDWRVASRHYLASGHEDDARRVMSGSIETILATGAYAAAQELATSLSSGGLGGAAGLVLRSRTAQQRAAVDEGLDLAEQAWSLEPETTAVLLNLVTARTLAGDVAGALQAGRLLEQTARPELAEIGRVYQRIVETSLAGSIDLAIQDLERLAVSFRQRGEDHYLGVALGNEAQVRVAVGDAATALERADEAISLLGASSAGTELISARLARAAALAHSGDIVEARREIDLAMDQSAPGQRLEVATEAAEVEGFYGQASRALGHLRTIEDRIAQDPDNGERALLARGVIYAQLGMYEQAIADLARISTGAPHSTPVFELRRRLAVSLILVLDRREHAVESVRDARALASRQEAGLWTDYALLLEAVGDPFVDPSGPFISLIRRKPVVMSMGAELVLSRLDQCDAEAAAAIRSEASARPWRWLEPTRRVASAAGRVSLAAAHLLEEIGEPQDVALLRGIARSVKEPRGTSLGRALARRLAPRVMIEDLGRVQIVVGDGLVEGSSVRRKVLGLLCLLLTRARWTATREEVVDRLWPELDPQSALNSLNQTVYFLRRVFEPEYREETSPGYVQQDGETIWLDSELIDARSGKCLDLIRSVIGEPDPDVALALAHEYRGRFALDFAYEEWAGPYRDGLHASYLRVIERSIRLDVDAGTFARGVLLAERAAGIDPDSEELQLALVRIYRLAGAHAAAAEQYAHYSKAMKDLGVEPRPLSEV
jgi:LuxR family maltose regulon positive regulatory protein